MNTLEQGIDVVIYCRVSTKEQVEEGNSLITQERVCRDYCRKNGYEVAEVFVEQGESAKSADRHELQRLLAFCTDKRNGIKAVVIYKLDRLSRNTDDYSQIRLLLKRYRVEIKSVSEFFEDSPVGRFMENIIANVAQFDNDVRAERSIGGMKEAMREGRYVWMAPLGYRNAKVGGKTTIVQDESSAKFFRRAFQLVATGNYSTEEVRRTLTKEGMRTKHGREVARSQFFRLLANPIYAGWIVKFRERHRGLFPALVSDDEFERVQRVLKRRGKTLSPYVKDHPKFPLRRFVCDSSRRCLTGSWSTGRNQKYAYYRFRGANEHYPVEYLHAMFESFLSEFSFEESHLEALRKAVDERLVKATAKQRNDREKLLAQLESLKQRQVVIVEKNCDGVIPDGVLKQQLKHLEDETDKVEAALASNPIGEVDYDGMVDFVAEYLRNPGKVWRKATPTVQAKLQRFQFPQGVTFENNEFGTAEIASIFKLKSAFDGSKFPGVNLEHGIWNQFSKIEREFAMLAQILRGE